jgi:hypothetical protein
MELEEVFTISRGVCGLCGKEANVAPEEDYHGLPYLPKRERDAAERKRFGGGESEKQ